MFIYPIRGMTLGMTVILRMDNEAKRPANASNWMKYSRKYVVI